jgi:hypothetical protein
MKMELPTPLLIATEAPQISNAWMLQEVIGHNRIATTMKCTHVTAEGVSSPQRIAPE